MNIKEHIEAGHYPVDDMGFPLVDRSAGKARIISTTGPKPEYVIVGCVDGAFKGWDAEGNGYKGYDPDASRLLPPPPRKVKVTQFAVMVNGHDSPWLVRDTEAQARNDGSTRLAGNGWAIVELTGSYEEPWPDAAAQPAR